MNLKNIIKLRIKIPASLFFKIKGKIKIKQQRNEKKQIQILIDNGMGLDENGIENGLCIFISISFVNMY